MNLDSSRYLKEAYLSELSIHNKGGASWVTLTLKLLKIINDTELWNKQNTNVHYSKQNITLLRDRVNASITKLYYDCEFNSIVDSSELRMFKKFKDNYDLEEYVNITDVPLSWRKLFCAFRISCHDLEIERGRYIRPRKPPEERLCKVCCKEAETDM